MSEPAVLYELDNEPAAVDLTIAAVAMACRMSYSSVNTAIVDFMNGDRPPTGTLAHTAVACWLAVVEYVKIAGDDSHSVRVEAATDPALSENEVDQRVPDLTGAYVSK